MTNENLLEDKLVFKLAKVENRAVSQHGIVYVLFSENLKNEIASFFSLDEVLWALEDYTKIYNNITGLNKNYILLDTFGNEVKI